VTSRRRRRRRRRGGHVFSPRSGTKVENNWGFADAKLRQNSERQ